MSEIIKDTTEYIPRNLTVNLAGLSEEGLADISPFIGGYARKVVAEIPENKRELKTVIVKWGDPILTSLLEEVAQSAGYAYGGELISVVATFESYAFWMRVVPKTPYDPEDFTIEHESGEREPDGRLLALVDPALNPDVIFYDWDEEGAKRLERLATVDNINHSPWVDLGNYYMSINLWTTSHP